MSDIYAERKHTEWDTSFKVSKLKHILVVPQIFMNLWDIFISLKSTGFVNIYE